MNDIPAIPISHEDQLRYDPVRYLLDGLEKSSIPLVYINKEPQFKSSLPLVLIHLGPSGGGKDATVDPLLTDGTLVHAVTATSRPRRIADNEPESKYVWMRQQREDESEEEYHNHLIEEYDLIEYDKHFGALYGLPKASIYASLQKGVPVIRTEPRGAKTIIEKLSTEMNFVVTFVVPESYALLWSRIYNRYSPLERIEKAVEEIREAPKVANYYLFNPLEFDGKPGLAQVQESFRELIINLRNRHGFK